jgi:hypothetical protein
MPTLIARGCAALAIVLLAPLAASAAGSPLKIESVSPSDRSALPADTEVIVAGRTVTLGALRDQHAALLHSFSAAATLGRQAASSHPVTLGVQMKVVPLNDPFYARYSADYRAFCGAAQLTICAYLPAATTVTYLAHNGEIIDDFFNIIDPLITDATLCQSQGGTPNGNSGCRFMYPAKFHEQFNPGAPGAMAQSTRCTAGWFTPTVDPHGAAGFTTVSTATQGKGYFVTPASPVTCVIVVTVPKGTPAL